MRVYSMTSRRANMTNSKPPTLGNQHLSVRGHNGIGHAGGCRQTDGRACVLILDLDLDSVSHVACLI